MASWTYEAAELFYDGAIPEHVLRECRAAEPPPASTPDEQIKAQMAAMAAEAAERQQAADLALVVAAERGERGAWINGGRDWLAALPARVAEARKRLAAAAAALPRAAE